MTIPIQSSAFWVRYEPVEGETAKSFERICDRAFPGCAYWGFQQPGAGDFGFVIFTPRQVRVRTVWKSNKWKHAGARGKVVDVQWATPPLKVRDFLARWIVYIRQKLGSRATTPTIGSETNVQNTVPATRQPLENDQPLLGAVELDRQDLATVNDAAKVCGKELEHSVPRGITAKQEIVCTLPAKRKEGECGKRFKTRQNLERHKREHHRKGEAKYVCKDCQRKFYRGSILKRHVGSVHSAVVGMTRF